MTLPPALAAHAARQNALFTTAQALAAGFNYKEVQRQLVRGSWIRLRRGIYVDAGALPDAPNEAHLLAVRAVLMRLKPPTAVSHISAAAMHGFALLDPDFRSVHVTRPQLVASRYDAGVHHHSARLDHAHVAEMSGLTVTTTARTIVDLARESTFEQGLVAAESALFDTRVTHAELFEVLMMCRDWPGARNASRVVGFASSKSQSPGESRSRIAFEALGLPQPEQQVEFRDTHGLIGFGDFYWRNERTVGEFDGRGKYAEGSSGDVLFAEKRREDRLRELGLEVVRFGMVEVTRDRRELRRRILAAFARSDAHERKLG